MPKRRLRKIELKVNGKVYIDQKEYINFSSNDYLGLSQHPRLKIASIIATEKYGTSSASSRLLSGDLEIHHQLEEDIAKLKGKEKGLVFNSGYQANIGIISAICNKDSVIFVDRLCHASIIDGILLSKARFFRFLHNDMNHLESLLKKEGKNFKDAWVITESIFSMDGDKGILSDIVSLKERYDFSIFVDEAHATGIFGRDGAGLIDEFNLTSKIDLIMGTFSKALGSFGGYVVSNKETIELLINKSRGFIYSTSLPPSVISASIEAIKILKDEPERRKVLLENTRYFREKLKIDGETQIVPLILGDEEKAISLSNYLLENGFFCLPIMPPTVPKNSCRIRFSLCFYHKKDILDRLMKAIYNWRRWELNPGFSKAQSLLTRFSPNKISCSRPCFARLQFPSIL